MKSFIYLSLLLSALQVHCHHDSGDRIIFEDPPPSLEDKRMKTRYASKIAPGNADFAFRFYKQIASDAAAKNIFFSPLSICTAFAMLTLAAKFETQSQIYKGLGFNLSETEEHEIHKGFHQLLHLLNDPNNKAQVNLGNALFVEESLKILPKFLEDIRMVYQGEGFSANFQNSAAVKNQINDYVQTKTHGKISHAVDDLDPRTVMVLLNYIYFKANWKDSFSSDLTKEDDFFVDANTTVKVPLMYRNGNYNYLRDDDLFCCVVEVPYKGDATAFFILPDRGKLEHVETALAVKTLAKWKASFRSEEIHLYLPKFSISASYDVKDLLQKLGVVDAFSDNADLSGITGERDLKVSKAVHKAVVDVHESGTEAAAVTVVEIAPRFGSASPDTIIKFDSPFLFTIVESFTDIPLFLGKIVNPTEK
ncbi:alpha-1-antitrypsin-like [Rhineura floridana]|uniref:alpha-1-antitrypsin-like n=1 Tax=Rhineura floridana TaxID=261503 RepID=UPI002AC7F9DB|nr:alpha-1-antitrypsin-like [Rhineura floridana]